MPLRFSRCWILIAFFFTLTLSACIRTESTELADETVRIGEEVLKDVKIIVSQQAQLKMVITAPCLYRYKIVKNQDRGYTKIDENAPTIAEFNCGVLITFFDSSDKVSNTVRAAYGKYEEQQQNILLKKNVIITSMDGDSIWTEEMHYNSERKLFLTDSAILIRGTNHTIRGIGFESEADMRHYKIFAVYESQLRNFELD